MPDSRSRSSSHRSLPALIEESISTHASRTALILDDGPAWTYRDLGGALVELSHRLVRRGVQRGDVVVYRGERGPAHVLSVLAVWRIGAAVAVVAPGLDARLHSLRRRVRPRLVLGEQGDPSDDVDLTVPLHHPGTSIGSSDAVVDLLPAGDAHGLAYLLSTSGSTGEPKNVAVPHTALAHRCGWAQQAYPLTAQDVVLASSSPSFDFCFWETFAPLTVGAAVAVAPPEAAAEPDMLAAFMRAHAVTVAHFVPSLLRLFLRGGGGAALGGLRLLLLGGEPLTSELCDRVRGASSARLWNQYGPTEACIDVLAYEVGAEDLQERDVPIGRPIDGMQAVVLDGAGRPVGPGGTGELHLSGPLLAWGYAGMPGRTASRFVPAPTGGEGQRLYRTGDLVRRTRDDLLVYVGRTDQQVKIRGVRIEPSEVEAVLAGHADVREAAVVVRAEPPGVDGSSLTAHIVLTGPANEQDLRGFLAVRLPAAALPSRFVVHAGLPRLPSGKVDRGALSVEVGPTAVGSPKAGAPLGSEMEVLVGGVWSEVLDVPMSGSVNFFDAGGTSLTAMRAAARVRRATGLRVPVRLVFEAPVLGAYAARLEALSGGAVD